MIDVLIVGGTWAPYGESVTDTFSRTLDLSRFAPRMVPYPADYGGKVPYAESSAAGKSALLQAIGKSSNRVVIAGYSQGAAIAGDLAAEIGSGLWPNLEVLACALIADPLRPAGRSVGPDPGGYGIAGQRTVTEIPTFWAAAPGDPITALPAGNALRLVADLSQYFCMSSPEAALRWGRSLVDAVLYRRIQRWWVPRNWSAWSGALAYARGYLTDGRHTDDYVRFGHAACLAETINREVA
ncbi:PE-PPE domain-containing protein [Nocardia sp. SYP-A9097]|uniref:PE-PPE domain-containing protein n=1 Tax=Nocardia sp. SYP-A9097 TaxID=2663237 RepID=UPI00129A464C|nr:PE-PPE domain-containing protein [Nocardia sp. SYP-A9097]MRH86195.1 PE-PPE domain-containing protein [Nocardia sp. SYP-A9097]